VDINTPIVTPDARQIVGRLFLNGTEVPFVSAEVDSNSFYSADTFSAVLAISAMPAGMGLLEWWSKQQTIELSLQIGIKTAQSLNWKTHIIGAVDRWTYKPACFEVHVEGRDYTARLIDTKTSEKFANYTTSQVATMLAQRHGLTPVVTATTTAVGGITKFDHTHCNDERSEWDLLSYFAGLDGFQVYVAGNELHYEPALDPATADQYVIKWMPPGVMLYPQANTSEDVTFERDLTLGKGVTVQVRSWKGGKAYTAT
jgi:phage protein D